MIRCLATGTLVLFVATGCALGGRSPRELVDLANADPRTRCESDATLLAAPARLVERARAAYAERDAERAYCDLALIRTLHPDSREAHDVFPDAAALFRSLYLKHRSEDPGSDWLESETSFIFAWLESFFVGEEFPRRETLAVVGGMPRQVGRELIAFMARSTGPMSDWKVTLSEDNGLVEDVEAVRTKNPPSRTPAAGAR
jgi:hypothetical protein